MDSGLIMVIEVEAGLMLVPTWAWSIWVTIPEMGDTRVLSLMAMSAIS